MSKFTINQKEVKNLGIRVDLDATTGYQKYYPCPPGGRGYTFWKDTTMRTISPGGNIIYSFTCDTPPRYQGKDNCELMLEKIHTNSSSSADDVPVRISIKSALTVIPPNPLPQFIEINTEYHSKIAAHDFWLSLDLGNDAHYDDDGYNEIKVENLGNVSITIYSCSIHRIYMDADCPCSEVEHGAHQEAANTEPDPLSIDLDPSRIPWPCEHGKGGRGYTFWKDDTHRTIAPGDYLEYKFTCDRPSNYVAKDVCLALLDKVQINSDATTNDAPIRIKVNGLEMHVEYHSKKKNHDIWIGVDLAPMTTYNDVGENVLRIENLDSAKSVSLLSCYIYRIYRCQPKP